MKQSGLDVDEFVKSYRRPRPRLTTAQRSNPARCAVEVNGRRCPSKSATRNLCETHYRQWNKRSRRSPRVTLEEWMATGEATIPDEPLPDCIVPACRRESMTSATKVCRLHWARYMRGGRGEPIEIWARQQLPHIGVHQFMLLNLPERLRWEVLYAVQQRAGRGGRIDPENTKAVIRIMEAHPQSGHDEQGRSRSNRSTATTPLSAYTSISSHVHCETHTTPRLDVPRRTRSSGISTTSASNPNQMVNDPARADESVSTSG